MTPRRPRPAAASSALPTLGALLGGAAALAGCHDPVCGSARVDELRTHATDADRALRQGELSTAGRDIAIALGVSPHGQSRNDGPQVAGAAPVVQPPPPPQTIPPPEMVTGGVPAPVDPTPPQPPPEPVGVQADGQMPAVRPTPPSPPQPTVHPSGGAIAVQPALQQPVARTRGGVSTSNPVPPVLPRRGVH